MKDLINIIEKLKVNSKSKVNNDWTIEDAKDGDIIITKDTQFIYKCLDKNKQYTSNPNGIIYHACYSLLSFHNDPLHIGPDIGVGTSEDHNLSKYKLSSKEECKELFDALKQKGYEWDDKNLKLVKI